MKCTSLKNVEFVSGITSIGSYIFQSCSSLESVIIPVTVNTIGSNIISDNTNVTIYYEGNEEQWNNIDILEKNDVLNNSKIVFNYKKSNS